jgi:uncharacterized protein (DUF1697 family)
MKFTQVAMIRGINVGGSRPVKMDRLRALFAGLGYPGSRTYLQSGNVVFDAARDDGAGQARAIAAAIRAELGHEVDVLVRSARQMTQALRANPLAAAAPLPRMLYATFLEGAGKPTLAGLDLPLAPGERAELVGGVIYLYCPGGYGNSKVHNVYFERKLGVRATTRNWATVTALEAMAHGREVPA